ncbi:MAG: DNA helicase [Pseudomonadota bacterium]
MNLSAPIHVLRSRAKLLTRERDISLSSALNEAAKQEGFASWSLLMRHREDLVPTRYSEILDYVNPGDLMLVAARPAIGKTTFTLGLGAQVLREEQHLFLFSLTESEQKVRSRLDDYGVGQSRHYMVDCSDAICADYIVDRVHSEVRSGDMVVIDYLQMLDERRVTPPLQAQVVSLKTLAQNTGCIVVCICQLQRAVDERHHDLPTVSDIRLPNPLNLDLFNKIVLLSAVAGREDLVHVHNTRGFEFQFNALLNREPLRVIDV